MPFTSTLHGTLARHLVTLLAGTMIAGAEPPATPATPAAPPPAQAPAPPIKLPGISIDVVNRNVDVEAMICLDKGMLELIACTKDSKEHESLIVIAARPSHIHAALLLLGARNGSPAMRQPTDDENTRWIDVPPSGDLIDVFLVSPDAAGKMVERPLGDFVSRVGEDEGGVPAKVPAEKFPSSFLFAGSHVHKNGDEPGQYLAESSGNIISIATFGDELLCLSQIQSHDNGALAWQVDSTHIPKLGTKVTLRLRPQKQIKKESK